MVEPLTLQELDALRAITTPTVCKPSRRSRFGLGGVLLFALVESYEFCGRCRLEGWMNRQRLSRA